jgi:ribosome maturation protein Sdo1
MVHDDAYEEWKKDHGARAIVDVVDSFDVLKFDARGKQGTLARPSNRELQDIFGTTNEMKIVEHMLEHGSIHKTQKKQEQQVKETKYRSLPGEKHRPL